MPKEPWGVLQGVRPTKLARNLIKKGVDPVFVSEALQNDYEVSKQKADIVARVLKHQTCIIRNESLVNLYINIPICPSRCSYCTFISAEYKAVESLIQDYVDALITEIRAVKKIIANKPYVVRSIYVGGGTPTVLNEEQLDQILQELSYPVTEFTVECGRPDTITESKLQVLKRNGVTRICINPQTFSQRTLRKIGRSNSTKDVINAYMLALKYDFKVNMDLIAGFEGETLRIFKNNIKTLLELSPNNVTIHTLAVKKNSEIMGQDIQNLEVESMVDYAYNTLSEEGYKPYYLYRQKHQLGGLENIGYCKKGDQCMYNIDSIEETCSIIACGANAMSKRVYFLDEKIERVKNYKFIHDYINNIDEEIKKKLLMFK